MPEASKKKNTKLIIWIALIIVVTIMMIVPPPEGLTSEAMRALALLVAAATMWLCDLMPVGASSLLIMALLALFKVLPAKTSFSSFGGDVIFMYIGGFIVARSMSLHGFDKRIALTIINKTGTNKRMIVLGLMLGCALISAWMSTVVVVFALLPVVLGMIKVMKVEPGHDDAKMLLFALLWAGLTGGLATPVGTAPNLLVMGFLRDQAGIDMSFSDWMVYGVPLAIILTIVCWFCIVGHYKVDKSVDKNLENYVKDEYKGLGKMEKKELLTAVGLLIFAILLFTVQPVKKLLGAGFWSDGTASLIACTFLFITNTITWKQASAGVNWGLLLLFAAGGSISSGLRETGAAEWLANLIGNNIPVALLPIAFTIFGAVFTQVTSNTATTAILGPIAVGTALAAGIDPVLVAIPTTIAISLGWLTPIGSAPSPIVFGEMPDGNTYIAKGSDYTKAGIVAFLVCLAIVIAVAVYIIPMTGFTVG